jgi:hypothetical protein
LLLVATAAAAIVAPAPLKAGRGASLALTTWRPDADLLAAMMQRRDATIASALPKGRAAEKQSAAIVAMMRVYLADEVRLGYHGVRADPTARTTLGTLEEAIRAYALQHGNEAFRALAATQSKVSGGLVAAALAVVMSDGSTIERALRRKPMHPSVAAVEQNMPGLALPLARIGIARQWRGNQLDPAARLLVEALVTQRWMVFAQRLPPPLPQVDSDTDRLLLAFKVEAHARLSTQRKLELLETLSEMDATYPTLYVTGVLLAREGRYVAARQLFLQAAAVGQQRRQARANARWCRDRAKRQRTD